MQKQLQMDGLALNDIEVLHAMDADGKAVAIPPTITKAGVPRKNAKVLDAVHLDSVIEHSKEKAAEFSQRMLEGDISIQPVSHGDKASCDTCRYRAICAFDPLARGVHSKEIYSMSFEELKQRLDQPSHQ